MPERLEFSEFTFGYALTENLSRLKQVRAAPIFPSLIEEGQPSGAYDVALQTGAALPLLLQFKVPQILNRSSSLMPPGFACPYYRAHLRTRLNDQGYSQHSVLLTHEANGYDVYYASPRFHRSSDLDRFFLAGSVVAQTAFFRPSDVGLLTDEAHHVAYCSGSPVGWLRSELTRLPYSVEGSVFLTRLQDALRRPEPEVAPTFDALLDSMVSAAETRIEATPREVTAIGIPEPMQPRTMPESRLPPRRAAEQLRESHTPAAAAALFARFWLDAELFLVSQQ